MGKSFNALCFVLILLAAAPHFSRGGACCNRLLGNLSRVYCNNVLDCLIGGKDEIGSQIVMYLTDDCDFGDPSSTFESWKTVYITKHYQNGNRHELSFRGKIDISVKSVSILGLALRAGSANSTLNIFSTFIYSFFEKCVFLPGLNIVFKSLVHVNVQGCHLNLDAAGPTMLEIEKGAVKFVGEDNIVRCTKGCNHPTVKVNICSETTLNGVMLDKQGPPNRFPIFEFSPCAQAVKWAPTPTLRIEGITFRGQVPTKDSSWMIVRGDDVIGPTVNLTNIDYAGIKQTQIGTVYRFIGTISLDGKSNFILSRSSTKSAPSGWSDEDYLATTECSFDSDGEMQVYTHQTLPIGLGKVDVRQYDLCTSYCCYAEKESGKKLWDTSIAGCADKGKTVYVVRDCPLDKPRGKSGSMVYFEKIVKAETVNEDRVAITLEEGAYQFRQYFHNRGIVFENIHFKKATGAGDGTARIHLGYEQSMGVNERADMIGCYVDTDVVVKLRHDVHFNATETIFNQGSRESVLPLVGDGNQVVRLSGCVLNATVCHTMFTGPMCGNVTIKDTRLSKNSDTSCTEGAVYLTLCNTDIGQVPNLEIKGITFEGEGANERDAAWIKVEGSHDIRPKVTLLNNLTGSSQVEWVYRFAALGSSDKESNITFSITREAGQNMMQPRWKADKHLATVVYKKRDTIYFSDHIFPIGNGTLQGRKTYTPFEDELQTASSSPASNGRRLLR